MFRNVRYIIVLPLYYVDEWITIVIQAYIIYLKVYIIS